MGSTCDCVVCGVSSHTHFQVLSTPATVNLTSDMKAIALKKTTKNIQKSLKCEKYFNC